MDKTYKAKLRNRISVKMEKEEEDRPNEWALTALYHIYSKEDQTQYSIIDENAE